MYIKKLKVKNFKCFKEREFEFNKEINILVGVNDVGKSTILEAIHLCLTGFFRGKYLKNNLIQDIFNNECVNEYLKNEKNNKNAVLPECLIEVYFDEADPILNGMNNSENEDNACISYSIKFNSKYDDEYKKYVELSEINSLPIEYYDVEWKNSADKDITSRSAYGKSILIDIENNTNVIDSQISKIIKDNLSENESLEISQLYRDVRDKFINDHKINEINNRLSKNTHILDTKVQLDIESLNQKDWEKAMITKINSVPFNFVGKGIQAAIKIELSLKSNKADNSEILLIEEPENHLTYARMNKLINEIVEYNDGKQIFITTHSSFVANKLNIKNLILLSNSDYTKFTALSEDTINFFTKKPGYDTLRLLLCKKAILVEGDADELVVQKAYLNKYGCLPIENEVDIISVGTTFLRFLEIANLIKKQTVVVTDNDGNIESLENKYDEYLGENAKPYIKILYDNKTHINQGKLKSDNGGQFNYDTLEPCMLRANNLTSMNRILGLNKETDDDLIDYMVKHKTECALKIFDTKEIINFPKYIEDAIDEK